MGFFQLFSKSNQPKISQLHSKLIGQFPEMDEEKLELYACYAGLLTRVAYADLQITQDEIDQIKNILQKITNLNESSIQTITKICVEDMNELSGIEDHYYTKGLVNKLSETQRSDLLCSLFVIAASDNEVDAAETEAIRNITTGLNLSHQHFIAAKAQVKDYLKALGS